MDQVDLDAAYDQAVYAPLGPDTLKRLASDSLTMRTRIGAPLRFTYGPTEVESLNIYRTGRATRLFLYSYMVAPG